MFRHCESFDALAIGDIALKYAGSTANSGSFVAGRTNNGFRPTSNAYIQIAFDAQATWIAGIAIQVNNTTAHDVFTLLDAGTVQFVLSYNANGTLTVKRGSTTIATSTRALRVGQIEFIELKVTIGNTGSYSVKVNSEEWLAGTGVDTQQTANASADSFRLTTQSTDVYDDWYVFDGTGATQNDFAGDVRVYNVRPSAAGNYTQLAPTGAAANYQAVSEAAQNGDTSYAASGTAGQKDSYAFSDLPTGLSAIAATLTMYARKDDAGARTVRPIARLSSTDYNGASISLNNSYAGYLQQYAANPAGGAWSTAALNGAEFGFEIVS